MLGKSSLPFEFGAISLLSLFHRVYPVLKSPPFFVRPVHSLKMTTKALQNIKVIFQKVPEKNFSSKGEDGS